MSRLKLLVTLKLFNYFFGGFKYPFTRADEIINQMSGIRKLRHFKEMKDFYESDAYAIEILGIVRHFYKEMATKPTDEMLITGYRLSLIFIKYLELRLKNASKNYDRLINQPKI
jgi:hypothetical protein